jgi:hypothetical protein
MPDPPGNVHQCLKDTSSRKSALKRTKGQPEGSVVTDKTRKPWVAEKDLVSDDATGQNNSNLTLLSASAENLYQPQIPMRRVEFPSEGSVGCTSLFLKL